MNRVEPIYEMTVQIEQLLNSEINSSTRPEVITEINSLLQKREKAMLQATEPFSNEELALGKKLLPLNEQIQKKMEMLFTGLKTEMKQIKKQKNSNRKYVNPYENIQTIDGMFMDKKK
ncbi:flagellar protein FliT [Ornithinibacillus contaminans]|uniref:flagellar protein FliT n=1 Tax=Ornithinibacillus contaminans TaxID=694055 RepID=UPI00064D9C1A|nr:flagellar protein FliT [Ornithinibacillus contaminans]